MIELPKGSGKHATAIREHDRLIRAITVEDLPGGIVDRGPRGTVMKARGATLQPRRITTVVPRWG